MAALLSASGAPEPAGSEAPSQELLLYLAEYQDDGMDPLALEESRALTPPAKAAEAAETRETPEPSEPEPAPR